MQVYDQKSRARGVKLFGMTFSVVSVLFSSIAMAKATPPGAHQVTGRVSIQQVQVAFIGSGAAGKGRLFFHGRTYPFTARGLGIGGVGISKMTASGDVYDLKRLADFAGVYGQARIGWAVADKGNGHMWLANGNGVTLRLRTHRQGLMLAGGVDGVSIRMSR